MVRTVTLLAFAMTTAFAATPTVSVTTAAATTPTSPITFLITFNQPVEGLLATELTVTNGSVANLQAATAGATSAQWLVTVQPVGEGAVTLFVPAGVAQNTALEGNQLSNTASIVYDTPPVPTISVPAASPSSITFRLTFDQTWSIADATALIVRNALITSQSQVAGSPFPTYDVVVAPFGYGTVTLAAGAGAFRDSTANSSPAVSSSATVGPAASGSEAQVLSLRFLSATDRSYVTGESVDIEALFSRPITVAGPATGIPALSLNATGSAASPAIATFQSVAGGNALRLRYTVVTGNYTPALEVTDALALNVGNQGGVVGDDGFLARLTLPSANVLGASGVVGVNFVPPKPSVAEAAGPDETRQCGVGSGLAALLGVIGLGLLGRRKNSQP